jgi:hypothetical protein
LIVAAVSRRPAATAGPASAEAVCGLERGQGVGRSANSAEAAKHDLPPAATQRPKSASDFNFCAVATSLRTAIAQVLFAGAGGSQTSLCLAASSALMCA